MDDKRLIVKTAESLAESIWQLASQIGNSPEEGYREYFASGLLAAFLEEKGFTIQKPLAGIQTSFLACYKGKYPGPRIAFLAEYDALPGLGHACGHNLIGSASVGAAVVLRMMPEFGGEVLVIGTPAEETSGAKVPLVKAGVFDNVDAAMMFHPGSCNVPALYSLALDAVEVSFHGKAAHMAVTNNNGINALDALISLFQKLKRLKARLRQDERIDGVITHGGTVPNIVPDLAVARFYLRAAKRSDLNQIRRKFLTCAGQAAEEAGARMAWRFFEPSYDEMKTNLFLAELFRKNLLYLGITDIKPAQTMIGSVDMGNVSQVVPAIHPYLRLGRGSEVPHSSEFTRAALSSAGKEVLNLAIKALALTAWDVFSEKKNLIKIRKEFQGSN